MKSHTRGETLYVDDLNEPEDLLFGAVFVSSIPHGKIKSLDLSKAKNHPGVKALLTADQIPGENQIGNIIMDEPLFAEKSVHFMGQPIACVLAKSKETALQGRDLIHVEYVAQPPVFDPREAAEKGELISPVRTLVRGNPDLVWDSCDLVVEGKAETGAQEHLYLETQACLALPQEGDGLKICSATQAPTAVQRIVSKVLKIPMNRIEVEVRRLGGAFGGKEDQATPWAVMAALGAYLLKKPVKITLHREEDIKITGKRHPYSSDYKMGLNRDGVILAYEAAYYQNAGAAADLSPAIMERSLFHATNAYAIPDVRITGYSCKTNLPPFTAFRGFGAPQAVFVIESAIHHAAQALGVDASKIQKKNLLKENDAFPYGMGVKRSNARRSFKEAQSIFAFSKLLKETNRFNKRNRLVKRGVALAPICFGISFTNTFLNQAGALVQVYTDGSVSVNTGAVEMGQGVNPKIQKIAALTLGIPEQRILMERTNTKRIPNTSPTAASSGADINGMAAMLACEIIRKRLIRCAAEELGVVPALVSINRGKILVEDNSTDLTWESLVQSAYLKRINLSAQAHFAPKGIHYDKALEKGAPFTYHVFGTAVIQAEVDCLRGTLRILKAQAVHDAGKSLDHNIDQGQIEGGIVQAIGWMTSEEMVYCNGEIQSCNLGTYKVPDIHCAPEIESVFLRDSQNPKAVLKSKAIGEPPFLYGIGSYFAVLNAIRAFRNQTITRYGAPLTPERVLSLLCD